ncbi:hypothetical protein B0T21DRAFT_348650 [Apiosordaria backusii]|uniref:2EXR domain-containing protein n=1 Tax=Apiosordaria backusii TaxID=314023 RepID=A0AA40EGB8_9PEZI|nr:hypothetical protein B0T21DRAFT_348650 [Apiosordaria backusii]
MESLLILVGGKPAPPRPQPENPPPKTPEPTFHRFRSLPPELRAKVWQLFIDAEGLQRPRLVNANLTDRALPSHNNFENRRNDICSRKRDIAWKLSPPPSILFQVSQEARHAAMRAYSCILLSLDRSNPDTDNSSVLYFNPSTDILSQDFEYVDHSIGNDEQRSVSWDIRRGPKLHGRHGNREGCNAKHQLATIERVKGFTDIICNRTVPVDIAFPVRAPCGDLLDLSSVQHIHVNIHSCDSGSGNRLFGCTERRQFIRDLLDLQSLPNFEGGHRSITISVTFGELGMRYRYAHWMNRRDKHFRPSVFRILPSSYLKSNPDLVKVYVHTHNGTAHGETIPITNTLRRNGAFLASEVHAMHQFIFLRVLNPRASTFQMDDMSECIPYRWQVPTPPTGRTAAEIAEQHEQWWADRLSQIATSRRFTGAESVEDDLITALQTSPGSSERNNYLNSGSWGFCGVGFGMGQAAAVFECTNTGYKSSFEEGGGLTSWVRRGWRKGNI